LDPREWQARICDETQELFVTISLPELPIVSHDADRRVLGIVRRADIASTYLRHVHGHSADQSVAVPNQLE
jgi:hypothetical protein